MDTAIRALADMVKYSEHTVFFGGAGVSCESGIPDFRSAGGIYDRDGGDVYGGAKPETILSRGYFYEHTELFYRFYRKVMYYPNAKPNAAHLALAELERRGMLDAVITQNIDSLHTDAGSKRVYELHGSMSRSRCTRCGKPFSLSYVIERSAAEGIPLCDGCGDGLCGGECGGLIKPDVVLYGEGLDTDTWEGAARAAEQADLMIVAGTSLQVWPAASVAQMCRGKTVIINLAPTFADESADLVIAAPVGQVFARLMDILDGRE